ncbi:hypothetical protein G8C92_30300 [Paenibacillus donghaensis]|uniref:hypothetical protein n=1 Tax=Paenibacillus donghaensis TaxID=414771 RepID=UPI00188450E3|nr:hypothetical protein [Paenibacillus donghaensis]MBE9918293.1 hypothetical protein [Paenibacillus donghaensis]
MKSEKFEEWFDVAFERAASSSSLTSDENKQASWKKVKAQIEQVNRKRRRRRRMQLSGIVAASFIAGAILFSPPGVTKAISPIVKSVVDLGNGMLGIVVKNGDVPPNLVTPRTEDPDNDLQRNNDDENNYSYLNSTEVRSNVYADSVDMNVLQEKLSFTLPDLKQIPEEYHFDSYTLSYPTEDESKFDKITLKYFDEEKHVLWIQFMKLKVYQAIMSKVPIETETLNLNNDEVYFSPGVYNQLLGFRDSLTIQIGSDLPKNKLVHVYSAMKPMQ